MTDVLWLVAAGVLFFLMMRKGGCCGGGHSHGKHGGHAGSNSIDGEITDKQNPASRR